MNIDITINENKKISCSLYAKNFSDSFENKTPHMAVQKIKQMIEQEKESRVTFKDYLTDEILKFSVGDEGAIDIKDKTPAEFRVRLTVISRLHNMKFKTKVIDNQLIARRVS